MNCERVQQLMPLYLSGELRGDELAALESHVHECETCSKEVSTDRELDEGLRAAMLEHTPDVSAVLQRVHAKMAVPWWRRMPKLVSVSTIAAVVAAVVVIGFSVPRVYLRQAQRTIAVNAANDHYGDLVLQRHSDWTSTPQDVARFIDEKFPQRQDMLKAITPSGTSFEKVRMCNVGGTRYAHFVFRNGGQETSVFLAPSAKETNQNSTFHMAEAGHGLEVSEFFLPSLSGMIVGNSGAVPTEKIAGQLARTL
jgi:hypothetical protein